MKEWTEVWPYGIFQEQEYEQGVGVELGCEINNKVGRGHIFPIQDFIYRRSKEGKARIANKYIYIYIH